VIDREDVQGLALLPYSWQPCARFFFVSFDEGDACGWVARLQSRVSSAAPSEERERLRRNVAFTASGLRALGVGEESLASFPREFVQGMSHPERALSLGDSGKNAPEHWEFGGAGEPIDALFCVYAPTQAELEREGDAVEDILERFRLSLVTTEDVYLPEDGRDHLGVAVTPPDPRFGAVSWRRADRSNPPVPAGEFILGHRDARGYLAEGPRGPLRNGTRRRPRLTDYGRAVDLGYDGTYLVVRKLEQDPAAVSSARVDRASEALAPGSPERHRFHRLLHRTRLYGPRFDPSLPDSASAERGVMFVAVNANLRRQFEFVHGALGGSTGAPASLEPCVRLRGGLYLFMPGLTALGYYAEV
jgi:hypothetical protein